MKSLWGLLLVCLLSSAAMAQMNEIEFTEYTLDNGLHVILHQDESTPSVAVSVMYHVGSKNEDRDRTGFAHFFEHLLFEGSENMERGEFDDFIEGAGGYNNANTSFDRTYYYEVVPAHHIGTAIWLESERMLHAKVEDVGIETQRQVVKEERRQRVDNQPYGTILEKVMDAAYTVHPYKTAIIGSMDHLDAAEENDYKTFYKTYYVPNNAVLSIAGNIDMDDTKAMIEKYFGSIPKGAEVPRPNIVEPPMTAEVRDTVYDKIQLPAVVQAYRIPAQGTKDYYAVSMLATLLADGQSSRLNKSLVDDQQLALGAAAIPLDMEDPGVTLMYAIANMGIDAKKLEDGVNAEVKRVQDSGLTDREFQKLRNQVEAEFVTSNAGIEGIAENLANYHMYYGDADLINTEINRYLAVTKADIQRVAKEYFQPTNRVTLHYLPEPTN